MNVPDNAVARPAVDRIDTFFSFIERLPRGKRVASAAALILAYIPVTLVSFLVMAFVFVMPGWISLLERAPGWILPALVAGPAILFLCAYLQIRFGMWRDGETRAWSQRKLLLGIATKLGMFALCGHLALGGFLLARADFDLLASFVFILVIVVIVIQGFRLRPSVYTDVLGLSEVRTSLFPVPDYPEREQRLVRWSLILGFYLPMWLGIYAVCLLT